MIVNYLKYLSKKLLSINELSPRTIVPNQIITFRLLLKHVDGIFFGLEKTLLPAFLLPWLLFLGSRKNYLVASPNVALLISLIEIKPEKSLNFEIISPLNNDNNNNNNKQT